MAVASKPVHWTTGRSDEPYAAWLLIGRRYDTLFVNTTFATTPWHAAVIRSWAEINRDGPGAILPAAAIGIRLV